MALVFRDQQVLVLSPGSDVTRVQMGMSESLVPASIEIPTVIYKRRDNGLYQGVAPEDPEDADPVRPIVKGAIVDEAALHYFFKIVYTSLAPKAQYTLPPALYFVTSLAWNRRQIERLVNYLFEEVGVPAVALALQGIVCSYAYAASDCLVIDIGHEKTEITAIHNFDANRHASVIVDEGSTSINKELAVKLKPQGLSDDQIEDLKRSPIYEILSKSTRASNNIGAENDDDDNGLVDVAAIVSSGRAREILEEREKQNQGQNRVVPNSELSTNTFTDKNGQELEIGNVRFEGSDKLIRAIVAGVGEIIWRLRPRQQQQVLDSVILAGKCSRITGLREALVAAIEEQYIIKGSSSAADVAGSAIIQPTPSADDSPQQAPTSVTVARVLDHFPEWKNQGAESLGFLGAQIGAKQAFTAGLEGVFASRQDYNEVGPQCIWDVYQ